MAFPAPGSARFSDAALEASACGIYVYDLDEGRNVYTNARYEKITGWSPDALADVSVEEFRQLIHDEERADVLRLRNEVLALDDGESVEVEYRFRRPDGDWVWCLARETPFARREDGSVRSLLGSFIDITARRMKIESLVIVRDELATTTRELMRENDALKEKLASYDPRLRESLEFRIQTLRYELEVKQDTIAMLRSTQGTIKSLATGSRRKRSDECGRVLARAWCSDEGFMIRPALLRDVTTLLRFVRELAEFEKLAHDVVADEDALRESLFGHEPAAEAVLGEVEGEPVAFAFFFHNYSTFLARPGLYLEDLYVAPAMRGRGFGRAMLVYLARLAVERGCGRFEWSVLDWNEDAIGFYRSIGAVGMKDWTVQRLEGESLTRLAESQG